MRLFLEGSRTAGAASECDRSPMGRDCREGDAHRRQATRGPFFEFSAANRARSFGGHVWDDVCVSAEASIWGGSLPRLGSGNEIPLPLFTR